ncbi:MAG: hypothetical protein GY832_05285 [Chloroflexi bacterium]|nr:hypothetical protein [Chloroflexota bacterium]
MGKKPEYTSNTIVDLGATLMGHLVTDRSLSIHGNFKGDLQVTDTVFIDSKGLVSANVTAGRVVVQGVIIGNICAEQVIIRSSGKVWGDIHAQAIYVEAGGLLRGQVIISQESESKSCTRAFETQDNFDISPLQPLADDDLTYSSIQAKTNIQESLCKNNSNGKLAHTITQQHTIQQNNDQNRADKIQSTNTQSTVQLDEKEKVETVFQQADLETIQDKDEMEKQERAYTAYCLICRTHRHIKGAHQVNLSNGRRVIKGHCTVCGIHFLEQLDFN